jgi:hypothetical protein
MRGTFGGSRDPVAPRFRARSHRFVTDGRGAVYWQNTVSARSVLPQTVAAQRGGSVPHMFTRRRLVDFAVVLAVPLVSLGLARSATAIPYIPPASGVINQPALIPPNGVLAVGTTDQQLGTLVTTGTLLGVANEAGEVSGTASQFSVPLGASLAQTISVWTPSVPFGVGDYTATGEGSLSGTAISSFSVVASSADPTALTLEFGALVLSSVQVPAVEIPCGTTFGLSAEMIAVSLVTHYESLPTLNYEFLTDAPDEVLSQFLFRPYQPDGPGQSFVPLVFSAGVRSGYTSFSAPQDTYCIALEAVSLLTQEVIGLDPACVDDDGRDWDVLTPATSAQIDAALLACPEVPEEYLPRYCALARERNVLNGDCDAFTDAELDDALANPVVPDEVPDQVPDPEEPSGDDPAVDDDVAVPDAPAVASQPNPAAEPLPTEPESAPAEDSVADPDAPAPNMDDVQPGEPSLDDAEPNGMSSTNEGVPSSSDGGCRIGVSTPSGSPWWLLFPLSVLLTSCLRRGCPPQPVGGDEGRE